MIVQLFPKKWKTGEILSIMLKKSFNRKKTPSVCHYGSSSWGMVGHNLFYDRYGILYGFYGRTLPEYDMTAFTLRHHIFKGVKCFIS
jgi:hypothetical protein